MWSHDVWDHTWNHMCDMCNHMCDYLSEAWITLKSHVFTLQITLLNCAIYNMKNVRKKSERCVWFTVIKVWLWLNHTSIHSTLYSLRVPWLCEYLIDFYEFLPGKLLCEGLLGEIIKLWPLSYERHGLPPLQVFFFFFWGCKKNARLVSHEAMY